jgi:hypothetical protein
MDIYKRSMATAQAIKTSIQIGSYGGADLVLLGAPAASMDDD